MSDKPKEPEDAWKTYVGSLTKWKLAFELWQKAGMESMLNYNKAIASGKINKEQYQKMSDVMKTSWMEQIAQFQKEWQNMVKASGLESLQYMNGKWAKFWTPMEPATTYGEAVKQFTQTWQNMWKK